MNRRRASPARSRRHCSRGRARWHLRYPLQRRCHKLGAEELVRSYKLLAGVERPFKTMKSVDLQVRPVHHRLADRMRAHIFLCMLAYYVRWHLERAWAPLLFRDEDKPLTDDVVAPARRSNAALATARTHKLDDATPVHGFRSLLAELATLTKNTVRLPNSTALRQAGQPHAATEQSPATPRPHRLVVARRCIPIPNSTELALPQELRLRGGGGGNTVSLPGSNSAPGGCSLRTALPIQIQLGSLSRRGIWLTSSRTSVSLCASPFTTETPSSHPASTPSSSPKAWKPSGLPTARLGRSSHCERSIGSENGTCVCYSASGWTTTTAGGPTWHLISLHPIQGRRRRQARSCASESCSASPPSTRAQRNSARRRPHRARSQLGSLPAPLQSLIPIPSAIAGLCAHRTLFREGRFSAGSLGGFGLEPGCAPTGRWRCPPRR